MTKKNYHDRSIEVITGLFEMMGLDVNDLEIQDPDWDKHPNATDPNWTSMDKIVSDLKKMKNGN